MIDDKILRVYLPRLVSGMSKAGFGVNFKILNPLFRSIVFGRLTKHGFDNMIYEFEVIFRKTTIPNSYLS